MGVEEIILEAGEMFGDTPERVEGDSEDGLVESELGSEWQLPAAMDADLRRLASLRGVNWDDLPEDEQHALRLELLSRIYTELSREWVLSQEIEIDKGLLGPLNIELASQFIDLAFLHPGREQEGEQAEEQVYVERLGPDMQAMLAYVTGYSLALVYRYRVPWMTRRRIGEITEPHYSKNQVYQHLLRKLEHTGLFEVSSNKGFRLNCDPQEILNVLQNGRSRGTLKLTGYDEWRRNYPDYVLLEDNLLRMVLALQGYVDMPEESYLDREEIRSRLKLSYDRYYENLAALEKLGILRRKNPNQRYRVGDMNASYIAAVAHAQRFPIVVEVHLEGIEDRANGQIDKVRAEVLDIAGQVIEFPEEAWVDQGGEVEDVEFGDEGLLDQVGIVLTNNLARFKTVVGQEGIVYTGFFPETDSEEDNEVKIEMPTLLGILDFLGIGRKELERIGHISADNPPRTLAAAIRSLEDSSRTLKDGEFVAEVKARLASLLFQSIVPVEEAREVPFAELMALLFGEIEKQRETQVEIDGSEKQVVVAEEQEEQTVEEEGPRRACAADKREEILDENILKLITGPFRKELAFATREETIPLEPLTPIRAFYYHRSLSNKAGRIPWGELENMGLAIRNYQAPHPGIEPVGALITAILLNNSVYNQVRATQGGIDKALRMVGSHTAHILQERLAQFNRDEEDNPEYQYIKRCLEDLEQSGVVCRDF